MDIIQAMLCHTFFWLLAAGLWPYLGYLLLIYLTRLDLSGKSKYNLYLVSDLSAMFIDYFLSPISLGWSKTFGIGQTGFCTEVELELREKKAGKLGGMKNWYLIFYQRKLKIDALAIWPFECFPLPMIFHILLYLQAHIRSIGSRIAETILSLRFFIFQYGIVYKLHVQGTNTSLTVLLHHSTSSS